MFEVPELLGTPDVSIALQTKKGDKSNIPNRQALEPGQWQRDKFQATLRKHEDWSLRKPPCGCYNCAGHIWASRRTSIYEGEWYDRILDEDGYRQLPTGAVNQVQIGDLVVYRMRGGKPIHVGEIVEIREGQPSGLKTLWVLSKWCDYGGEVLHVYNGLPLEQTVGVCDIELWTDRPQQ